jgi:hypothetical protein
MLRRKRDLNTLGELVGALCPAHSATRSRFQTELDEYPAHSLRCIRLAASLRWRLCSRPPIIYTDFPVGRDNHGAVTVAVVKMRLFACTEVYKAHSACRAVQRDSIWFSKHDPQHANS